MSRQVISSFLGPFIARIRELGGSPEAVAERAGIPVADAIEQRAWLTRAQVRRFCEEAAVATADSNLGLSVARSRRRGSYGLLEFGSRCAPDLRTAFQFTLRYTQLLKEGLDSYFDDDPREARYGFLCSAEPLGLGRHGHEFKLVGALLAIRSVVGESWRPRRIWFTHSRPPDLAPLEELTGAPEILFEQPDNGMALSREDLELPLLGADVALFNFLERQARRVVAGASENAFTTEVREHLRRIIGAAPPSLDDLAQHLHMSSRTLQRKLGAEGLTFQLLLDQVRQELATRHVAQSERSTQEIAHQLGYASVSAFLRAFKRWTGTNPVAYRRRARADLGRSA